MLPRPDSSEIDRRARLRAKPRSASIQHPDDRVRNFDEVNLPWTPEMAMEEAGRCLHCPDAPCVRACPLGNDIPLALWLTEHGDFDGAAEVFRRTNNFSEICSRVCPQPEQCESVCPHLARGLPAVAIGRIEGFLADRWRKSRGWQGERPPCSGHRVAVVGSGPAGLTVAELLAREGHRITVYEQWPHGGGVLRYGIPRFKLDHGLIRQRLDYLHEMGVQFVFDTRIGEKRGLDALFSDGFEAVFLGTGARVPITREIPGADLKGIYQARDFLVRANVEQNLRPSELEDPPEVGRRVAVIGGGPVASDCGRTALRLGAEEVTCFDWRPEGDGMRGARDRRLAREEGVGFEWLAAPVQFFEDGRGHLKGMRGVRVTPGSVDPTIGRVEGSVLDSGFEVALDTVVLDFGFTADPALARGTPSLETDDEGRLNVESATGRTTLEKVWAGGENVMGPCEVALVVAQARIAARDMHQKLSW